MFLSGGAPSVTPQLALNDVELDRDPALDKYRRALVFGFMWPLGMTGGYDTLETRSRQLSDTMLEHHVAAVHDTDAPGFYPWRTIESISVRSRMGVPDLISLTSTGSRGSAGLGRSCACRIPSM